MILRSRNRRNTDQRRLVSYQPAAVEGDITFQVTTVIDNNGLGANTCGLQLRHVAAIEPTE